MRVVKWVIRNINADSNRNVNTSLIKALDKRGVLEYTTHMIIARTRQGDRAARLQRSADQKKLNRHLTVSL